MSKYKIDIDEYYNPMQSKYIDDDVKKEFKGKSYPSNAIIEIQLIKTMKDLMEKLDFMYEKIYKGNNEN